MKDVPAGRVLVDGLSVGDVGNVVLRDRGHLAQDGLVIVVASMDSTTGELLSGPDIVSRGFVYVKEADELMNKAHKEVLQVIQKASRGGNPNFNDIKTQIRDTLGNFIYKQTKRSPMILPIIMEL